MCVGICWFPFVLFVLRVVVGLVYVLALLVWAALCVCVCSMAAVGALGLDVHICVFMYVCAWFVCYFFGGVFSVVFVSSRRTARKYSRWARLPLAAGCWLMSVCGCVVVRAALAWAVAVALCVDGCVCWECVCALCWCVCV